MSIPNSEGSLRKFAKVSRRIREVVTGYSAIADSLKKSRATSCYAITFSLTFRFLPTP